MDTIAKRFARQPGQVPRAAVACYAAAVGTAVVALGYGMFRGNGRSVSLGLLEAAAGAIVWTVLGTTLALLAEIADRP